MNVVLDGEIRVSLSERNLKDLARQASEGGNWFLQDGGDTVAQLVRVCAQPDGDLLFLRVVVESDAKHYGEREPGPGVWGDDV